MSREYISLGNSVIESTVEPLDGLIFELMDVSKGKPIGEFRETVTFDDDSNGLTVS